MANRDLSAYHDQHQSIREEFGRQAMQWAKNEISADLRWVVERIGLQTSFEALDVAAGTGLLSRAMAPHVKSVVAVDLTPEMLSAGRAEAERSGITNLSFEQGPAEDLPYAEASFDVVATRFSFHHFLDPGIVASEMYRVCRDGGRIVVIDLVAPEERELAVRYNSLERLRDPTHTRALAADELKRVVEDAGARIVNYYSRDVEMSLGDWLDFTHTAREPRAEILAAIERELGGSAETGMRPFVRDGELMFLHRWGIVVGERCRQDQT